MKQILLPAGLLFLVAIQCTSTRWTVADMQSIDERDVPEVIDSHLTFFIADSIRPENPYLSLRLYEIRDLEYVQRIRVERTIQQYKPKWGFAALGALGASIAFYAGNTNGFIGAQSQTRSLALNSTGLLLTAMAFTNMQTVGEPIRTGETQHLRRSGTVVRKDTIPAASGSAQVEVVIRDEKGDERMNERFDAFDKEGIRIDLSGLARNGGIRGPQPGEFEITVSHSGRTETLTVPASSFLRPVVQISDPVAELRHAPVYDEQAPLAEVAEGSELPLIDQPSDRWYEIRFGGTNLFLSVESGEIVWKGAGIPGGPNVITVEELPFGEVDVEYAIPVLNPGGSPDFGLIVSNHLNNQIGSRRYLERDYRLMELYYREALGVAPSRIVRYDLPRSGQSIFAENARGTSMDSSTVYVYIGGYARIGRSDGEENQTVELIHVDEQERISSVDLEKLLEELVSMEAQHLVVFADLDFRHRFNPSETPGGPPVHSGRDLFRNISEKLLGEQDKRHAAFVFASRPDQSSGLFESNRYDNNYHHIFPYFLAQGLQQRRTGLSDLVRHVENQVDYTSRRLHDRPQSVQAFGNLSIRLAE